MTVLRRSPETVLTQAHDNWVHSLPSPYGDPEAALIVGGPQSDYMEDRYEELLSVVGLLTPTDQAILYRIFRGETQLEVATVVGISQPSLFQRVHRALDWARRVAPFRARWGILLDAGWAVTPATRLVAQCVLGRHLSYAETSVVVGKSFPRTRNLFLDSLNSPRIPSDFWMAIQKEILPNIRAWTRPAEVTIRQS